MSTFCLLTLLLLLRPSPCIPPIDASPTLTFSSSPTATPILIEILIPSLESLGLSPKNQTLLERQGWTTTWDAVNSPYTIHQLAWDEASPSFTDRLTHKIGWIDLEGNLHPRITRFSATEDPTLGKWPTSTTQDLFIDLKNLPQADKIGQTDENGAPLDFAQAQQQLEPSGIHLLQTKKLAFAQTGILTLSYFDENSAPQTIFYNRELDFLPKIEISANLNTPNPYA